MVNAKTKVVDVIDDPLFEGYGRLIFPTAFGRPSDSMTLDEVGSLLLWHTYVNTDTTVDVIRTMQKQRKEGRQIFYDIYTEEFESIPVPRAVATLAVPTIISQVVTMIYNLADTFFVGQIGDPYMVAAVSLVSPWFNLLTALGNLFGLGGGSLISRLLGKHDQDDIKNVSAFSVWGGAVATLLFSVLTFAFREPLLYFLGASPDTFGYAQSYLTWVVVIGGVPTMLSLSLGHLLRSEGHARPASMGMMFGGILNVILDPVLIFGFQLDVTETSRWRHTAS